MYPSGTFASGVSRFFPKEKLFYLELLINFLLFLAGKLIQFYIILRANVFDFDIFLSLD